MVRRILTAALALLALHAAMPLEALEATTPHGEGQAAGEAPGHSCPDGRPGEPCPDGCSCLCCPGHGTAMPASPTPVVVGLLAPRPWPSAVPMTVPAGRDDDLGVFRPPRA